VWDSLVEYVVVATWCSTCIIIDIGKILKIQPFVRNFVVSFLKKVMENGKGKIEYAEEIARKINAAGVRVKRDAVKVKSKIEHIESCFKSAHDFSFTETGAGLKEKDDATDFNEAVLKKCPWYFDLLPIFQDRASARPKMTSDELDQSDSDEEDDCDEDDCGDDDDDGGDAGGDDDDDDGGASIDGSVHSIANSSSSSHVPHTITPSLSLSSKKKLGTGTKRFGVGGSSRPLSVTFMCCDRPLVEIRIRTRRYDTVDRQNFATMFSGNVQRSRLRLFFRRRGR
jgi:hypothetical protein